MMQTLATVIRREHFNAAHRIFNENWTDAENFAVFGKCSNPNYHGHNYELFVKVSGTINPETGYVVDLRELGIIVKEEIVNRFDHKNLNLDTVEFKNLNPTAENFAVVIYNLIRPKLRPDLLLQITLHETENNAVTYPVQPT